MIRKIVAIAIIAALSFTAGWISRSQQGNKAGGNKSGWTLAAALPNWNASGCVVANERERKLFELAVSTLEIAKDDTNTLSLTIGAHRFLGHGLYRRETGKPVSVCPPEDIYERVANIITASHGLKGRLVGYHLRLAEKLPNRSHYIVSAIANSAFNKTPQESETFKGEDIRPFARTVLASFGKQISEYSTVAYDQMSADDSLGTGAAQVAAAAGHPGALERIQGMMENILSSIPQDRAIPRNTRILLYELSYAIYFSGDDAKMHAAPIKDLMKRKVQSWAPPFGMIELSPKRMCEVLKRTEGEDSIKGYKFCMDDKVPFEQ